MKKTLNVWIGFFKRISDDHVGAFAAQASYFILLSFVPFLLLLLTLVQYTPLTKEIVTSFFIHILPNNTDLQSFLLNIIDEVYTKSTAFVPISAIFTLWSAGKGIQALTNGVNAIYHLTETRNYLVMRVRSAFYTLFLILALLMSLVLMVFGNTIQGVLAEYIPVLANLTASVIEIRTPFSVIVLALIFLMVYKVLPNRKASFRSQIPGALISSVAWSLFSLFFSIYLDIFHGFSNMYGSLTTVVLTLLWMYFCMYIVLIGAEINSYFEERLRELRRRTALRIRTEYQELLQSLREEAPEEEELPDAENDGAGKNEKGKK